MLTRRQLLQGAAAMAVVAAMPSRVPASPPPVPVAPPVPAAAAPHALSPFDHIIGESRAIRAFREAAHEILDRVAGNSPPPPVVITGETGTGKDLLARVLHAASPRADGPFLDICVAAIPEELLAVELFGCERGAFDGVVRARQGLFHAASGGTLLLCTSGYPLQSSVRRGITAAMEQGDVWVVATDHAPLDRFFHPIESLALKVPPLRERDDDVLLLAEHFLAHYAALFEQPPKTLSGDARRALAANDYPWPGNVRELSNWMERLVFLAPVEKLEAEHVQPGWTPSESRPFFRTQNRRRRSRSRAGAQ